MWLLSPLGDAGVAEEEGLQDPTHAALSGGDRVPGLRSRPPLWAPAFH